MRTLALISVTLLVGSSCGVSMLEISDAERNSLSSPGITKGETPDAGTPATETEEVDAGTPPPPIDAGVPAECEGSETNTCVTSCGSTGSKTCSAGHWGACMRPTESCDNGIDDD